MVDSSNLTEEQRARIDRNRQEALAKRARLLEQQQQQPQKPQPQPQQLQHHQDQPQHANIQVAHRSPGQQLNQHQVRHLFQQQRPVSRPAPPEVPVLIVDAHEDAIIEQAMMAAQKRPQVNSQSQSQMQQQSIPHSQQSFQRQQQKQGQNPKPASQQPPKPSNHSPPAAASTGPPVTIHFAVNNDSLSFSAKIPSGYHAEVISVFKTMKTRAYDNNTRAWSFQVREHAELVKKLSELGNVTVKALPANVISTLNNPADCARSGGTDAGLTMSNEEAERKLQLLPPDLLLSLMPFQREGVKFAVTHGGRTLIGDEMGLGKTLQGISIAKLYESDWPCLIVVPSALRLTWKSELLKWLPDLSEDDLCVVMKSNDRMQGRVTVISYDLLARNAESFSNNMRAPGSSPDYKRYGVIIVDESHFLKSINAKRTKALTPLSGTPALSRPAELYTQISALRPKMFPSWKAYAERYCDAKQGRFGLETNGASNLDELRALLRTVMIRRMKADVLTQLPAKRRQQVVLDLPTSAVKGVKAKLAEIQKLKNIEESPAYPEAKRREAHVSSQHLLNECYQESGLAKVPQVNEYINTLAEGGCKFLVFAHHKKVLDDVCASLQAQKPPVLHIRIDGDTPMALRENLVRNFQNDPRIQVAVLSITAAGTGLTLTAANAVVFAELSWVPGQIMQAEDRAHRIGQQYSVNIHFLLAKDTVDDIMWAAIEKKLNVVGNALDGKGVKDFGGHQTTAPSALGDPAQPSIRSFLAQSPGCAGGEKSSRGACGAVPSCHAPSSGGEPDSFACGYQMGRSGEVGGYADRGDDVWSDRRDTVTVGMESHSGETASGAITQARGGMGTGGGGAGGGVGGSRKRQRVFQGDSDDDD